MDMQKLLQQSTKKPGKVANYVFGGAVVIMVVWIYIVSQISINSGSDREVFTAEQSARTSGLRTETEPMTTDSLATAQTVPTKVKTEPETEQEATSGLSGNALATFLFMLVFVGGAWVLVKRKSAGTEESTTGLVREIGSHVLGQGAQLKFLEINNEIWVLGLQSGSVDLLEKIPSSQWNEGMAEGRTELPPDHTDFSKLYKYFKN